MSQNNNKEDKIIIDYSLVIWPSILLLCFIAISFFVPSNMEQWLSKSIRIFGENTGLFYQLSIVFVLGSVVYFAFSKYGNIRFGDEEPEFTTFDWGSMIFVTCMAGGTIYWAAMEPLMHLKEVPFAHVAQDSYDAASYGMAFMLLRPWWIWGLNVLAALPICYIVYIKRIPLARFTEILSPIFGEKVSRGPIGKLANIVFILAMMMSYAGGIAVSIPIAAACVSKVIGVEHTMLMNLIILGLCTALYIWSTYMGLNGGIRVLSKLNVYLCMFLAAFIIVFGSTVFVLEQMAFSVGIAFDNFWLFLLGTDPYFTGTFDIDWSQFQILWNYSSAPLLAMFIARVSRGRTVRQILIGGMLCGVVGLYMNYGVVGSYSLYVQNAGIVDLETIMRTQSKAAAMIALLETLPFSKFMMIFVFFFIAIFSATTIDSCALVTSGACCKYIPKDVDPPRSNRLYWAIVQGAMGLVYMLIGGLTTARVLGSYAGFLMVPLVLIGYIAWYKYAFEYNRLYANPEAVPFIPPKNVKEAVVEDI